MALEVPQTLEYRAKLTWDDLILYHEGPSDVKESRAMDLKLCYNTFKFKEGETLTQTFTRNKALMNENTNHEKDSELASLFGKLKYEENQIDSIYETEKNKYLVSTTPLLTAFFSTFIVQDFQDSPDDEEDTRSSHDYLNDLEEEYQVRALYILQKSSSEYKLELRPTKYFEAKYNKVKAKLALLSLSASASKAVTIKNKADDTKVSIPGVKRPLLSVAKYFIMPNHDTGRILPAESQRNTIDPSVAVTDSLATEYDLTDESSVCSTPLPPLKKLDGAKPVSRPKTIKSILKSKSTFKAETIKGVIIKNHPQLLLRVTKSLQLQKLTLLLLVN
ncbi:hypothetical protein Tco_1100218 [Tanacetum coccineum]